ncbi:MAG TPA: hypothetical protein PLY61_15135, partial [Anaerohalosphaeraceae bacterium]|nr:hypothetical protein [Anaerohalosphaeraceae bacterium]
KPTSVDSLGIITTARGRNTGPLSFFSCRHRRAVDNSVAADGRPGGQQITKSQHTEWEVFYVPEMWMLALQNMWYGD